MGGLIRGAIEHLADPETKFIDRPVDQLEVVVRKIGEEHQIANAALSALRRPGPGDFDVTNVQSRPQAFIVYVRRVQRDPREDYNAPHRAVPEWWADPVT
jgi:hypothetical protein